MHIHEALTNESDPFGSLQLPRQPMVDLLLCRIGAAPILVRLLTPQEHPLIEPPREILGWLKHMVDIGNQAGAIAVRAEHFGQSVLVLRDWPPAGSTNKIALEMKIPIEERIDASACIESPAGGQRR